MYVWNILWLSFFEISQKILDPFTVQYAFSKCWKFDEFWQLIELWHLKS